MKKAADIEAQYLNDANLQKRIAIHRFSVNKQGWTPFLISHIALQPADMVLELGCGTGMLWKNMMEGGISVGKLVMTDFSAGMLRSAQCTMQEVDAGFEIEYRAVDAVDIPFPVRSFDVIIANHMLYHVSDVDKAVSEIRRVLKPGGRLYCSTVGQDHMRELKSLAAEIVPAVSLKTNINASRFGLENGAEILGRQFERITLTEYPDHLIVPVPEPVADYIQSLTGDDTFARGTLVRKILGKVDFAEGLKITKQVGIFTAL